MVALDWDGYYRKEKSSWMCAGAGSNEEGQVLQMSNREAQLLSFESSASRLLLGSRQIEIE